MVTVQPSSKVSFNRSNKLPSDALMISPINVNANTALSSPSLSSMEDALYPSYRRYGKMTDVSSCGVKLGSMLGRAVGTILGNLLGRSLGEELGIFVGTSLGDIVGSSVGKSLGELVGVIVGPMLGISDGAALGTFVGVRLGSELGYCVLVGRLVGDEVGKYDGSCDDVGITLCTWLGAILGPMLGVILGTPVGASRTFIPSKVTAKLFASNAACTAANMPASNMPLITYNRATLDSDVFDIVTSSSTKSPFEYALRPALTSSIIILTSSVLALFTRY